MSLDPRYIIMGDLQQYFVDKDDGAPLAGGIVTFYEDESRTTKKPVYYLTGNPPDYSYIELPNPIILSSVGTIQDNSENDVIPYYFPYDANGNVELYYVTVDSYGEVPQFTRQAWPNFISSGTDQNVSYNYITNGQFLSHLVLQPKTETLQYGQITQSITNVAYGGWTFERPQDSTAIDIVTFDRFGSYIINPVRNPRYAIRVNTQDPSSGDTFKDIRIKFDDVNRFSSTTDQFTFSFSGQSNTDSNITVSAILIKNFGTGGSAETQTNLGTFTINPSYTNQFVAFIFGNNNGKTIGILDDDYTQLAIRLPVDSVFDVSFTDCILAEGNIVEPIYPYTSDEETQATSIPGKLPVPNSNGFDLYLPIIITQTGYSYDRSQIGTIVYKGYEIPKIGELLLDGTQYETSTYSSDGIPYARLFNEIVVTDGTTIYMPRWGTGLNYFSAVINEPNTNNLIITNNSNGSVTDTSDGAIPTGFTFTTIHIGASPNYYTKSYNVSGGDATIYLQNTMYGETSFLDSTGAGTTGFTVNLIQRGYQYNQPGLLPQILSITTIAASGLAGTYWNFESWDGTNPAPYYMWFTVDGSGSDPMPPDVGTGIKVNLSSIDEDGDVAEKIRQALNGWQNTNIITVAASGMTIGSYFTINSTSNSYYVWYKIDSAGTDPMIIGKIGIEVDILSTDTAAQVAFKTLISINSKYYAVPDFRGAILRIWSNGSGNDPNAASRWSLVPAIYGDELGTFQLSNNQSHTHQIFGADTILTNVIDPSGNIQFDDEGEYGTLYTVNNPNETKWQGGNESVPYNAYVNSIIKY